MKVEVERYPVENFPIVQLPSGETLPGSHLLFKGLPGLGKYNGTYFGLPRRRNQGDLIIKISRSEPWRTIGNPDLDPKVKKFADCYDEDPIEHHKKIISYLLYHNELFPTIDPEIIRQHIAWVNPTPTQMTCIQYGNTYKIAGQKGHLAIHWYTKALEGDNNAHTDIAQQRLADCYYYGVNGYKPDHEKALELFKKIHNDPCFCSGLKCADIYFIQGNMQKGLAAINTFNYTSNCEGPLDPFSHAMMAWVYSFDSAVAAVDPKACEEHLRCALCFNLDDWNPERMGYYMSQAFTNLMEIDTKLAYKAIDCSVTKDSRMFKLLGDDAIERLCQTLDENQRAVVKMRIQGE